MLLEVVCRTTPTYWSHLQYGLVTHRLLHLFKERTLFGMMPVISCTILGTGDDVEPEVDRILVDRIGSLGRQSSCTGGAFLAT